MALQYIEKYLNESMDGACCCCCSNKYDSSWFLLVWRLKWGFLMWNNGQTDKIMGISSVKCEIIDDTLVNSI